VLYLLQVTLGGFIHFVKLPLMSTNAKKDDERRRRPVQNYVHAVLGLFIIALAFYQVHTGYDVEYPKYTGLKVPSWVRPTWIALAVVSHNAASCTRNSHAEDTYCRLFRFFISLGWYSSLDNSAWKQAPTHQTASHRKTWP
jgi:hypothetical protein